MILGFLVQLFLHVFKLVIHLIFDFRDILPQKFIFILQFVNHVFIFQIFDILVLKLFVLISQNSLVSLHLLKSLLHLLNFPLMFFRPLHVLFLQDIIFGFQHK